LITSCSSNDEAAFCDAARTFGSITSELDVNAAASILGPNFWESLSENVDDLKVNAPDAFKSDIENLESDLNQFEKNLKANDYNLLRALLDPEVLESFTRLVDTIRETIENELTIFISDNCN
jgi:predicted lipid-binding transport protein (Tim44 family)